MDVTKFTEEKEALLTPESEFRCLEHKQVSVKDDQGKPQVMHFFVMAEHCQIPAPEVTETPAPELASASTSTSVPDSKKKSVLSLFFKTPDEAAKQKAKNQEKQDASIADKQEFPPVSPSAFNPTT